MRAVPKLLQATLTPCPLHTLTSPRIPFSKEKRINKSSEIHYKVIFIHIDRAELLKPLVKMMSGKKGYLAMKTDYEAENALISSDLKELGNSLKQLANHALTGGLGFGTSFLKWVAFCAALYLLILDRTNWKTNILTSLLIPYIFFTLPTWLFNLLRGEIGKWIAFIAVILRLFFPRHFPDWLELPASLILIIVVAPSLFADTIRGHWIGALICLIIGCYLLQEHIRASGGFRNSFTRSNGISNSIGILLLFIYPVWALILWIL